MVEPTTNAPAATSASAKRPRGEPGSRARVVHRVLTEKVFPQQAEVTTVDGWARALG